MVLPWARPEAPDTDPDRAPGGEDRFTRGPSAPARLQGGARDRLEWDPERRGRRALLLQPALVAAGLPYRPYPSLDDADRTPIDQAALTNAAVGLDILATELRQLT
ncbi:MAG: hypothetical protein AAB426_06865, partial [Myxococcota bacterium]